MKNDPDKDSFTYITKTQAVNENPRFLENAPFEVLKTFDVYEDEFTMMAFIYQYAEMLKEQFDQDKIIILEIKPMERYIDSDGKIDMQDLTLINALYKGALETDTEKQKTKFLVAADVDNNGKCNDNTCKITKNDIKVLETYIENPSNELFEAFKTVYLKGSYQKRAAASVLGIPLDLKISNLEKDTPKKLTGARFAVRDENGTIYGNIEMDKTNESIYLPVGNFIITQEEAKNGYDKYEKPIKISMDNEGNVELLEDYEDDVKLSISDDGNKDYLEISNTLGVTDIMVPPMEQDEKVVSDTIKQVSKTTGGFSLIVAATVATMARYGISYKLVLSRLIGLIKF